MLLKSFDLASNFNRSGTVEKSSERSNSGALWVCWGVGLGGGVGGSRGSPSHLSHKNLREKKGPDIKVQKLDGRTDAFVAVVILVVVVVDDDANIFSE
ncbi:hypothetical protein IE53DRAFT_31812 [Violaceomyces palustris]|uniref:Uncharacterized protein n=1 Tax=Violaceomyces palustris TaxID=1673888 RepID=A0ACD0P1F8_9BASI|nr:hypothetical protein IE53DRAFT_31812 [Violaceomyces palustris]